MVSLKQLVIFLFLLFRTFSTDAQTYPISIDSTIQLITLESFRGHFDSLRTQPHHNRKVMPIWEQSNDHDECRDYIFRSFQKYLGEENCYLHFFESNDYRGLANVIGVKAGSNPTSGIWVIGAHYDSNNSNENNRGTKIISPGANDNGTGLAAILEIARTMSNIETEATLIFAAWDFEEVFINGFPAGSNAWFKRFIRKKKTTDWSNLGKSGIINIDDLKGNLNFDMFGNPQLEKDGLPLLWACYAKNQHREFVHAYTETIEKYVPRIAVEVVGPLNWSDHFTFAANKIPAVENLESGYEKDPYYHTYADHLKNEDNIDFQFASDVTRGGLAFLMEQVLKISGTDAFPKTAASSLCKSESPNSYFFEIPLFERFFKIYDLYGNLHLNEMGSDFYAFKPPFNGWYYIVSNSDGELTHQIFYLNKKEGSF